MKPVKKLRLAFLRQPEDEKGVVFVVKAGEKEQSKERSRIRLLFIEEESGRESTWPSLEKYQVIPPEQGRLNDGKGCCKDPYK